MFPEGGRSRTGELLPVKQGFCMIAKRTRAPILPMAIEGTFAAWPPGKLPGFGNVHVCVGEVIEYEEYGEWSDEKLAAVVEERIAAVFAEAKEWCAR